MGTTFHSHSVSRSAPIKAAVEAVAQASPRICGTHRAQHRSQVPWIIQRVLRDATIGLASPLTVLVHLQLGTVATMIIVSRRLGLVQQRGIATHKLRLTKTR